ncbi:MAG: hypothetical protein H7249_14315 [Chitinophagaceae bacterium]|nr:hypothetical protein [Oligoflexus sp.]
MSIFGKKTSGFGFAEAEASRQRKDTPEGERISMPPSAPASPPPFSQPPLVQKAVPPNSQTLSQPQIPALASNQANVPNRYVVPTPAKEGSEVNKSPYTIEDVIRLMRELPDSKKEMVVIIVQKTLLSAKIDIHSIIEDAGRKVDKLQRQNDKMVGEIRELEEAIIQKKGEVDRLARDIDETTSVKQVFEVVYGRHVKTDVDPALPEKSTLPPAAPTSKLF